MRTALATVLLLGVLPLAGCGAAAPAAATRQVHRQAGVAPPIRTTGLARAAAIARRTYRLEAHGTAAPASVRRISRDRALLAALAANDASATRAAALHQLFLPHYHVVRLRVLRGSRSLVDVGGRFVSAGASGELRTAAGRPLGRLEASIQDVIGFVKLIHRRSGAQAVVRGTQGHVATLLAPAARAKLPRAGSVRIAGRTYAVRFFRESGFAREPLRVWILVPR